MKKIIVSFLVILLISISAYATEENANSFLDELLVSDIPVTYGDESFRLRILEKTKGERDPVGLVLTGGSARACAHIGVLKYLEENGIVPDFIISNSMGSIIGMLYAAGLTPKQIEETLLTADLSSLFSLTLPIGGGIVIPTGFRTLIESVVGPDFRLEDTDIPVMIVNDDLVTKREIRIAEGDFADILIGSFALPVYFDPYEYNGHLLVDGGIISLAPISVAYEYSDSIIISTTFYDQDEMELINPITILNTSFDIGKRQKVAEDLKKHDNMIWIRCAVENFSFMDFDKAGEMAQIGYESAKASSDQLAGVYKAGEISDNMKSLRADKNQKIDSVSKSLSYFDRIETSRPAKLLTLGLKNMAFGEQSDYYLKESTILGLDYDFLVGPLEMGLGIGEGFDIVNLRDTVGFTSLNTYIGYYPMSNFRIAGEAFFDFGRKNEWLRPTIYFRESIDYIPFLKANLYKIGITETLEYYKDYSVSTQVGSAATIFGVSTYYDGIFDFGTVSCSGGYLLTGTSVIWENPHNYINANIAVRGYLNKGKTIYLDSRAFTRVSIDGRGNVPLFFTDDYTTGMISYGQNQIYPERDVKYHNTIFGLELGYDMKKSPTFGEFLIVEDSEFGIYCDVLLSDLAVGLSTGVDIQAKVSLIGLLDFPLRLKLGYEYTPDGKHGFVASLRFSLKH